MTARLARHAGLPVLTLAATLFAATLAGCTRSSSNGFTGTNTNGTVLVIASGNNQSALTGTALTAPLVVTLTNGQGQPLSGQSVAFTAIGGGGSVSAAQATTNTAGQASTNLTLGARAGLNSVQATATVANVASGTLTVTFSETATNGAAVNIAATSGASQTVNQSSASSPLVVTVTDASGNPVAGALVFFNVTTGSGSLSTPAGVTNSLGQAQTTVTPTGPGPLTVVATVANATGSNVTFTITVTPPTAVAANPAVAFKVPGTSQIAGTVTLVNASTAVVGAGTTFTASLVIGSQVFFDSQPGTTYVVATITDDTHATLAPAYTGGNVAGAHLTILGFTEPRGIAVSQKTNALWLTAVYNGTIATIASPVVILKTTKTGGLTVNTPPIAMPSIPGTLNLQEPMSLALSQDESTLFILDMVTTSSPTGGDENPSDSPTGGLFQVGANGGPITSPVGGVLGNGTAGALGTIDAPTAMAISPDGQRLYITAHDPASHLPTLFGLDVNPASGLGLFSISYTAVGGTLVQPTGIGVSLDGKTLYIADSNAGPNGNAQLFSLSSSGGVSALNPLASGGISDTTRAGGGIVPGFDGGINLAASSGALGKISSVPVGGGAETLRTSSTGSGPFVSPFGMARDANNIFTVDSEATGNGCVVVSQ